ncbi:MAG: DegT/DnrJ/EryC1/StrS family aminotransferase [Phycisphaerales bacterium]|nr:DegT/DnrJ/EryC1/StrS family aminotransferase [Planctomycetota bacterium]MCH8509854.1 DegT/DnrJ/EryC1/StrS family aminotransferase [Phycisphaerales bacterium]
MATMATTDLAINGGTPVFEKPVPFMAVGLTKKDIAAATEVLESGMLRAASKCAALEERFAEASDAKIGLTCANGTCALQLAYGALLEPGDEVIVPAWTYIATVSMLVAAGAKVVFCDSVEASYQADPKDIESRITPKTKAIAVTHLYGIPCDIDAIEALAKKHNLKVIYDAAQAHLATYKGKGIGAFGVAVTYSFYATKNMGTGEGGMVTTNDPAVARQMGLLRSHGETDKYLHEQVGFNYRMNDITGAIGLSKLDELPGQTERRREVAKLYHARIDQIDGVHRPVPTQGSEPAWHLYTCRFDPDAFSCTRDEFMAALNKEGVPTALHYPKSLTRQPAFKHIVEQNGGHEPPVALKLAQTIFCIPIHQNLTDDQAHGVCDAIEKVANAFRK